MKPEGPVFDAAWRRSCELIRAPRWRVEAMIRSHYLGKWPGVCVLILAAKRGDDWFGCIVFALPPRETSKRYGGVTWELARLWLTDETPKNAETWLIGRAIRFVRQNYPEVKMLVSYADPSVGHSGMIYKAANWRFDGRTDDERKTPRFDYADAVTGKRYSRKGHVPPGTKLIRIPRVSKFRFIYPLDSLKESGVDRQCGTGSTG